MKMRIAFIAIAILACIANAASGAAAASKAPPNMPTASERPFVADATKTLNSMYATTSDAAKAGYFRYTNEDDTGAISWVNTNYWTSDEKHPSQLWYDAKGRLIGVDYSRPWTDKNHPPHMWGIVPDRWFEFESHVHYGIRQPDGSIKFGYLLDKDVKAHGGDPAAPTARDVVKNHKAKSVQDVAFTFAFPRLWDLEFWLVPNPLGVFAEKNPNVKPSKTRTGMGM